MKFTKIIYNNVTSFMIILLMFSAIFPAFLTSLFSKYFSFNLFPFLFFSFITIIIIIPLFLKSTNWIKYDFEIDEKGNIEIARKNKDASVYSYRVKLDNEGNIII